MMAFVRLVMAAFIFSGSILPVSGSMSAKVGMAPVMEMPSAVKVAVCVRGEHLIARADAAVPRKPGV